MTMLPPLHLAEPAAEPDQLAGWALKEVDTGERIAAIAGPTGAGKSHVVDRLRETGPVVVVEPPPLRDGDAVFHALAQLAAAGGAAGEAYEAGMSVHTRSENAARRLANDDRVLVLRLPNSWNGLDAASGRDQLVFRRRAIEILQGLRDAAGLRIIVLATRVDRALERTLGLHGHVRQLRAPRLRLGALRDEAAWGSYALPAQRAAGLVQEAPPVTPVEARVLVGCLALGADLARARPALSSPAPLPPLLSLLADLLAQPQHREIASRLAAPLAARGPLPLDVAEGLAALPEEHRPLLRDCIGYRTDHANLRVTESVRSALRLALGGAPPEVHARLAEHYRTLDGKGSLADLDTEHTRAWLEKLHHLAHGGLETSALWERQARDARELFWDRGRALSIDAQLHHLAADVYRACVTRFPDDAYAWHYLGYNLDRAGAEPLEAEVAFRRAVALEGDNRWWQSRLVSFLVEQARYADAEEATRAALAQLDPEAGRVYDDPQLAHDFHRWLVAAWLDAGELARARRVFELLPPEVVAQHELLRQLKWRLEDAEEADRLGDSVHPPGVRIDLRWQTPAHIGMSGPDGTRLVALLPARVVEASAQAVTLVVGVTNEGGHELVRTEMSAAEWQAAHAWCPAEEARGYLYLAYYESGAQCVYLRDEPDPPWKPAEPGPDPLRHLRSWAAVGTSAEADRLHAPAE
ncbi:uncharacterized protein SOCE26_066090 [Sorangium cellulosum]|uniref:Uncharacterized protein n=1 Tax=Sorangium cellulosum TaxID=56 RepID=A0A2L0F0N4_SORCE|nr:hypothetical protein [Sorangium cellulosum]AUX45128.1 uncharacterized protein SOCE26_066090 [Sorangium cellulosum]